MKRLVISVLALMLSACASQTSVDRHTVHAVHQLAEAGFDPNMRTLLADSIRLLRPEFQTFWQQGVDDRAAGLTRAQMEKKAAFMRDTANHPEAVVTHTFLGQQYMADRPEKERKIMAEALAATYQDGYEGRP